MGPSPPAPDQNKTFEEQLKEARKRTERFVNVRDRSSAELEFRLKIAGFSESVIECEVKNALSVGLVDDERFTRLYVEGKKRSGWGQNRIVSELRRFGIEIKNCEGYPERFFDEEEELKRAQECLRRFNSTAKNQQAAFYRRLVSKGFSMEISQKAVKTDPRSQHLSG